MSNARSDRTADFVIKIFLPILVALSVVAPFVLPVDGYDHVAHLLWIKSFGRLLSDGVLIPRWLPESFGGLGAPSFYFYPPLPYYVSWLVECTLPTLSASATFQMVGAIATWGSFFTFLYLLRSLGVATRRAIVPCLLYALAPYRFFALYTRNGFGEHFGLLFVPVFVAALLLSLREGWKPKYLCLLGISWAAIVLSNIPLAFVVALGALPLAWFLRPNSRVFEAFIRTGAAILLGTGVVAYNLIPILHFKPYSQIGNLLAFNGFPADPSYFLVHLIKGGNLTLGVVSLIDAVVAAGIVWFAYRPTAAGDGNARETTQEFQLRRAAGWICASILILNMPFITLPIWRDVIVFQLIQFTFRLDVFILLLGCLLYATHINGARNAILNWLIALWCVSGVALAGTNVLGLHVHKHAVWYTTFDPAEYAPIYTLKNVDSAIQFVSRHEQDPFAIASPPLGPGEEISSSRITTGGAVIVAKLDTVHEVVLHTFYWPQWRCIADGSELSMKPTSDGRIALEMPRGTYRATLILVESDAETLGKSISIASLTLLVLGTVGLSLKRKKGAPD